MKRSTLLALAAILLASSAHAVRAPKLRVGTIEVHPYYGLDLKYDDNIYSVNRDKPDGSRTGCTPGSAATCSGGFRGSLITNNSVGVILAHKVGERHSSMLGYDFTAVSYRNQPKANDAVNQTLNGLYNFNGGAFSAKVWENFVNTEDPPFNPNQTTAGQPNFGELVARERRWQNTAGVSAEIGGENVFASADAQDTVHKYLNATIGRLQNRSELYTGGKLGVKVQPKTKLYMALHRKIIHYSAQRAANSKGWDADLGLEGDITPKVKGQVQAGYHYRRYDEDPANLGFKKIFRDWQSAVKLTYKPVQRTSLDIGFTRAVSEAVSGGRFYTSTGGNLGVGHTINKLTVSVNGAVQYDKYSADTASPPTIGLIALRRDHTYMAGAKAEYRLQEWLMLNVSYQRKQRFSIFSEEFNYRDNQTSFGFKAAF